jgi:hypothetical protein
VFLCLVSASDFWILMDFFFTFALITQAFVSSGCLKGEKNFICVVLI